MRKIRQLLSLLRHSAIADVLHVEVLARLADGGQPMKILRTVSMCISLAKQSNYLSHLQAAAVGLHSVSSGPAAVRIGSFRMARTTLRDLIHLYI